MKKIFFVLLAIFCLNACSDSDHDDDHDNLGDLPRDSKYEIQAEYGNSVNSDGEVLLSLQIPQNTFSFQLISECDGYQIALKELYNPDGDLVFDAQDYYSSYQTDGGEFQQNILTFNYPVSTTTSTLTAGIYHALLKVQKSSSDSQISEKLIISSTLITKEDSNPEYGSIDLNVIFAGSVANDKEVIKDIKKALNSYSIPTLNKAGLRVYVNYISRPDITSKLPNPKEGSDVYEKVANENPNGINLFMGASVDNLTSQKGHSGVSASVPGPVLPTAKSAIAFSISKAVGDDGEFNGSGYNDVTGNEKDEDEGDEVRLFSDSISHEIFHYLGLRNSVEFSSNTVVWGDGLNSEKCETKERCEQVKNVRENVMYPYPIFHNDNIDDKDNYWYVRNIVSSDQRLVSNKWIGAN